MVSGDWQAPQARGVQACAHLIDLMHFHVHARLAIHQQAFDTAAALQTAPALTHFPVCTTSCAYGVSSAPFGRHSQCGRGSTCSGA